MSLELALHPGVIAGFVFASLAGLLVICGLIYLCYFCFTKANSDNAENHNASVTPTKEKTNEN